MSRSNRPNSLDPADWCKYSIDGRRNQGTDQDGYADYPMLGSGADTLVLSNLQLDFIGNSFQFSVVRAFPKLTLIANTNTCPAFTQRVYQPTATAKNQDVYVLQPAAHLTNPTSFSSARNPVYLVSTKAIQTRTYRVWRLSDGFRDTGRLTQVEVSGTHLIGNLPSAQQKLDPGSRSVPLDTRLPHVFQAVGRGDTLWFVHPTLCQIGGGTTEVCVRAVRVGVGQSAQGNYTAAIEQQTVFGGATDGTSYWMPTIAVNSTGQTIIGFLSSSRTTYLSSAWTLKAASATSYPAARVFNPGTCTRVLPEGVFTIRTGDFEGAQPIRWIRPVSGSRASGRLRWSACPTVGGTCGWSAFAPERVGRLKSNPPPPLLEAGPLGFVRFRSRVRTGPFEVAQDASDQCGV